ncbi:hypothetical protein ACOL23_12405, partial [Aliarcobacter butzleri]
GFIKGLSKLNSKINTKNIICDPFVLFYNKWDSEYSKNELISLQKPYFSSVMNSQRSAIWSGVAFEVFCVANIDFYLDARNTTGLANS